MTRDPSASAPHVLYLHGFASSPRSSKAAFLAARLRERGITLRSPDFNQPDFSTLTITRMIRQTGEAIDALPPGPVILVGSSLGAFVAVQVALARPAQIDGLILLAPALDFGPSTGSAPDGGNRMRLGDRSLDEWQRTNELEVFHYGSGRTMTVHYELYADAGRYDCANAVLAMPVIVFQGRRDTAVDPRAVEAWAASRPNVELHMLDDDHQLTGSLDYIWERIERMVR